MASDQTTINGLEAGKLPPGFENCQELYEAMIRATTFTPASGTKGDPGANGADGTDGTDGVGEKGDKGDSAYDCWLAEGNEGTKDEFLQSLIGPAGASAYEVWIDAGNTGGPVAFFQSLIGPPGQDGNDGATPVLNTQKVKKVLPIAIGDTSIDFPDAAFTVPAGALAVSGCDVKFQLDPVGSFTEEYDAAAEVTTLTFPAATVAGSVCALYSQITITYV